MPRGKKSEPTGAGVNSQNAAERLRSFCERYERLESDKQAVMEDQKELMAELKGEGYDTKTFRKVLSIRKRKAAEVAEEQAMLDLYLSILGMDLDLADAGEGGEPGFGADDEGGDDERDLV